MSLEPEPLLHACGWCGNRYPRYITAAACFSRDTAIRQFLLFGANKEERDLITKIHVKRIGELRLRKIQSRIQRSRQ